MSIFENDDGSFTTWEDVNGNAVYLRPQGIDPRSVVRALSGTAKKNKSGRKK